MRIFVVQLRKICYSTNQTIIKSLQEFIDKFT